MTAWTDNIMHIDHLEVLLHIEKKINLLITIDVMKKTLFLCAKNQLDEPSPKHGTVAAVLSLIFIVYTFGCCYTRWSSSLKFSAKLVFLEGTVNFQNYFLLVKRKYWFPCDWIFIFVNAAFIIHAWADVKKKKIPCWLGRKMQWKWTVNIYIWE